MKITALVENTAPSGDLIKRHGLSVYVETTRHKLLFDLGPDDTFLRNAESLGIDIAEVDIVIISHGHADHGGGLPYFLERNTKAQIYIHREAFEPHYTKLLITRHNIGLDEEFAENERITLVGNEYLIDAELILFANVGGRHMLPQGNKTLLVKQEGKLVRDRFRHETNLLIADSGVVALFTGCSHNGITNILTAARRYYSQFDYVIGGFHMFNPTKRKTEPRERIVRVASELKHYRAQFYTCHCTGAKAFDILREHLGEQVEYFSTGMALELAPRGE